MASPLISVIMTAYNSEKFIRESINSVLNQTYTNLQFIIINDGSTDSTAEIISSFSDPRIEYYSLAENCHIAYATNLGFSKARGQYIAIMDSDDVWLPQKLEKQLTFLQQHPEHEGCFSWVTLIDETGAVINDQLPELLEQFSAHTEDRKYWLRFFFFHGNRLNNPSSLITYKSFQQTGYHSLFYIQATDFEWWVRFTKKHSFGIIEEPLIKYRRILNSEINVSSISEIHNTRFATEYMYIRYHFFDDLDDALFIETFQDCFRCHDSNTPDELLCEKAFLLISQISSALGLLKLEELLSSEKTARLLKERYHFSTIECGAYTGKNTSNHLHSEKELEKWLNMSQQHIRKLESTITELRSDIIQKEAKISQLDHQFNEIACQNDSLKNDLIELTHSTSWRITAPFRFLKDKIRQSKKNNSQL